MTNEIMRPITLIDYWDEKKPTEKTIDALSIHGVQLCYADFLGFYPRISYSPDGGFLYADKYIIGKPYNAVEEATAENMRILDAISEARNAPVLATEEVLAGLPSFPDEDEYRYHGGFRLVSYCFHFGMTELLPCITIDGKWFCKDITVTAEGEYQIQAYNCDKTLEYLLQFTLDGVRKENK